MMSRVRVGADVKAASKLFTIYVEDVDENTIVVKIVFNEDKIEEVKREVEEVTGGRKTLNVDYVLANKDRIISNILSSIRNSIFMSAQMMGMKAKYKPLKKK